MCERGLSRVRVQASLGAMGIDTSKAVARVRSESRGRKRDRSASRAPADGDEAMGDAEETKRVHSSKARTMSRGRSASVRAPSATGRESGIKVGPKKRGWVVHVCPTCGCGRLC